MEINKRTIKIWFLLVAFGIALFWALQNLYRIPAFAKSVGAVLSPLLLGLVLAFVLNVLMVQVEERLFAPLNRKFGKRWAKLRRPLSLLLTFGIIGGILTLILLIIVPELAATIMSLANSVPGLLNQLQQFIMRVDRQNPAIGEYLNNIKIDWASISNMLAQSGQKFAGTLVGSTIAITTNIFHLSLTLILGIVIALNILVQKEKLKLQLKKVLFAYLPLNIVKKIIGISSLTSRTFSNFIAGQCTEACILGTLCFIGMQIFRFPYALLISVFVVFMALIPILGSFLSTVVGALLIVTVNPLKGLWFVVFFVVLQQLEGNLIFPRVVGSKIGLPALWVLTAVVIGGNTMGVIGMLISIPLFSVLYVILRENVYKRLGQRKAGDTDTAGG